MTANTITMRPELKKQKRESSRRHPLQEGAGAEASSDEREKKHDAAVRLLDNPKASPGALAAANRFLEEYFLQGRRVNTSFDERQRMYEAAEGVLMKEKASDGAIAAANKFIEHYFL